MTVVDVKVGMVEQDNGFCYGRFRMIRRQASGDQMVWKGPGGHGETRRVWSWRTAPWPGARLEKINRIANSLGASPSTVHRL